MYLYICYHPYSTNRIIKHGLVFPISLVLVVSLAFSVEYSKGQSIPDVSKFTTRPDIGTEEEPTINDDAEEEQTIEDDEPEPESTDEEDNDTVTSAPPKRPFGTDLELKNLTGVQIEDGSPNATEDKRPRPSVGKLILASCEKNFPRDFIRTKYTVRFQPHTQCNVPGAIPGDNVVVSSTKLDDVYGWDCFAIAFSEVREVGVVRIGMTTNYIYDDGEREGICPGSGSLGPQGNVIFSIIVFQPLQDIVPSEELQTNDPNTFPLR